MLFFRLGGRIILPDPEYGTGIFLSEFKAKLKQAGYPVQTVLRLRVLLFLTSYCTSTERGA